MHTPPLPSAKATSVCVLLVCFLIACSSASPTDTLGPTKALELGIGSTKERERDGAVMVYVPGGTFQMGSTEAEIDAAFNQCEQDRGSGECRRVWFERESPQHTVTLDAFWIDKTEVTNAQYRKCVEDEGCQEPPKWCTSYGGDLYGPNQPAVCVRWVDAEAYCEWAGVRLPTEAEWEYAARGPDGNEYPWGDDDPTCELVRFDECSGKTAPVGSLPDGASWCEALDMAGNAWEWVADRYGDYSDEAQTNPTGPETGDPRVLRGGAWYYPAYDVRSAYREFYDPGFAVDNFGFRCAGAATPRLERSK